MKKIGTIVFGLLMLFTGAMHFIKPEIYNPFISDFLPKLAVNYATAVVEILIGVGMFIPSLKSKASMVFLLLMIAFLPLHIADVFRQNPAIGNLTVAYIRLPLQFVLIYLAYLLWRSHRAN